MVSGSHPHEIAPTPRGPRVPFLAGAIDDQVNNRERPCQGGPSAATPRDRTWEWLISGFRANELREQTLNLLPLPTATTERRKVARVQISELLRARVEASLTA